MTNRLKTVLVMCLAAAFMAVSCEEPKVSVTGIQIIPAEKTLNIDESFEVMVMITPENATNARYQLSVEDPTVLSLEANKAVALAAGETNVIATSEDGGMTATCKVTVRGNNNQNPDDSVSTVVPVTDIAIDPESITLLVGESIDLHVNVLPENATNPNYTLAADCDVVTLSGDKVTAVKAGTAVVTATTEDGGLTAVSTIVVEEESEPVEGGNGRADGYVMTIKDVLYNDIHIAVDAPNADSDYFVWAEKESLVGNWTDKELVDYTIATVYEEFKDALGYSRIDSVINENGHRGDKELIRISNVYKAIKAGGESKNLRLVEPETRYVVYGYGIDPETGAATTGVFRLTTATVAAATSDEIVLKGTAANNIIVDMYVADEEMPYFMFFRKTSEIEGLTEDEIYQKDMEEDIIPAAESHKLTVAEYVNLYAMRGSEKNYNLLANMYLEAETEYSVYFYGFDEDGVKNTPMCRVDAATDAVVPSEVTFSVAFEKNANKKVTKLVVTPSDENAVYVLHPVVKSHYGVDSIFGDYKEGEEPEETVRKEYVGWLVGYVNGMAGRTIEQGLLGTKNEPGKCKQGIYDGPVGNTFYSGDGDILYVVAFTVDAATGVITSDPMVVAEIQ